jgi:hypothetical protein
MSKKTKRIPSFTGRQDNHRASTKKAYAVALLDRQKARQEKKVNVNATV